MKISVIIPTRNEEEGIAVTLQSIPRKEIKDMGYDLEVLVVDNNSSDRTVEIAKRMDAIVINETTRGYGLAYKVGFKNATGDIIVTSDADGTYPLRDIPRLLKIFEIEKLEFLNTDRITRLVNGNMPKHNKLGNQILNYLMLALYGIRMKDTQSGMWIFRKYVLDEIKFSCPDIVFAQELKLEICFYEHRHWSVVGIDYNKRIGESKLMNGWNAWKNGILAAYYLAKKRFVR